MHPLLLVLLLLLAGCGYHSVDLPLSSNSSSCSKIKIQNRMPSPWLLGYIYQNKKIIGQIRLKEDIAKYLKTLLPCEDIDITIQEFKMRYVPGAKGINLWAKLFLKVRIHRPNHLWIKDILVVRKVRVDGDYEERLAKIAQQMLQEAANEIKRLARQ